MFHVKRLPLLKRRSGIEVDIKPNYTTEGDSIDYNDSTTTNSIIYNCLIEMRNQDVDPEFSMSQAYGYRGRSSMFEPAGGVEGVMYIFFRKKDIEYISSRRILPGMTINARTDLAGSDLGFRSTYEVKSVDIGTLPGAGFDSRIIAERMAAK